MNEKVWEVRFYHPSIVDFIRACISLTGMVEETKTPSPQRESNSPPPPPQVEEGRCHHIFSSQSTRLVRRISNRLIQSHPSHNGIETYSHRNQGGHTLPDCLELLIEFAYFTFFFKVLQFLLIKKYCLLLNE